MKTFNVIQMKLSWSWLLLLTLLAVPLTSFGQWKAKAGAQFPEMGYLVDSSYPNMLWFSLVPRTSNDAFVGFRCDSNSLLKQAIEQLAPHPENVTCVG